MTKMRKLLGTLSCLLLLSGCATSVGQRVVTQIAKQVSPDQLDALDKLANHGLLQLVAQDATDTQAWVDTSAPTLGPIKTFQARQCPTAASLAGQNLQDKINGLITLIKAAQVSQVSGDPLAGNPEFILFFTQLKFGVSSDPQAQINSLMTDIGTRLDAVVQSCLPLFPTKQLNQLFSLIGKAGLSAYMPALAPFINAVNLNPLGGLVGQ